MARQHHIKINDVLDTAIATAASGSNTLIICNVTSFHHDYSFIVLTVVSPIHNLPKLVNEIECSKKGWSVQFY